MKNQSLFKKVIILMIVAVVCLALTVTVAFFFGNANRTLFDFKNLNLANMLPVFAIGGFFSCVIIGFLVLFLAKDVFVKVKDYFKEENGGNKK